MFPKVDLSKVKQGHPQALIWLKAHLDSDICEIMLSDWLYSGTWSQKLKDKFSILKDNIVQRLNTVRCARFISRGLNMSAYVLLRLAIIAVTYLDFSLDSILILAIIIVVHPSLHNFTLLSTQITILLLSSIFVPMFVTAVGIAFRRPQVVMNSHHWIVWKTSGIQNRKQMFISRLLITVLFPLVPGMIILSSEEAKDQIKSLKDKHCKRGELMQTLGEWRLLIEYINETRIALLTFKRNELSMELVIQLSIHLTMVLLSQTEYPVENGLQAIFQSSNKEEERSSRTLIILILSVFWSFKTTAITAIKIKTESKNFLPIFPKIILGVKYILIFLVRIGCIVTYFSPFIGLIGIMNHYSAERLPLDWEKFKEINDTHDQQYHYWNPIEDEFDSVDISKLHRSDYTTNSKYPDPPSPTLYTVISLQTAYIIFWAMFIFYAVILTIIKSSINKDFKSATFGEKLQHIIEALNMPESYGDWDTENDLDISGHQKKWRKVLMEMLIMVFLQLSSNMSMLVPFFVTGMLSNMIVI